jgi:hypothetical protein
MATAPPPPPSTAGRLARHLHRDPLGAVRKTLGLPGIAIACEGTNGDWDQATLSKGERKRVESRLLIEGGRPHAAHGRRLHAERFARHLQRDPIGAVRHFCDYRGLLSPAKVPMEIGIERAEGRLPIERAARTPSAWLTTFNGASLGAARNFAGVPMVDAAFYGTIKDWDRGTRSKAERNGSRVVFLSRAPPARSALGSPPPAPLARCCTQLLELPRRVAPL